MSASLVWLSFRPKLLHAIAQNSITFIVLACVGITSLFFHYDVAKRRPQFAIGIAVGSAGLILVIVCGIATLALHLDKAWLNLAMDVGQVLIFLTPLILIWQGLRKSKMEGKGIHRADG
jgi:hypothetical protein